MQQIDFMNCVCKPYLDKKFIVFIDEILPNQGRTQSKPTTNTRTVEKEKLYVKFSKYELGIKEVHFMGHVVSDKRIHVDPYKNRSKQELGSTKGDNKSE